MTLVYGGFRETTELPDVDIIDEVGLNDEELSDIKQIGARINTKDVNGEVVQFSDFEDILKDIRALNLTWGQRILKSQDGLSRLIRFKRIDGSDIILSVQYSLDDQLYTFKVLNQEKLG